MSISWESTGDVLKEVARRLKRPPSTEELAAAQKAGVWNPLLPVWDKQDLNELVRYLREHTPKTETGDAPDEWFEHSASVMERFREEQAEAMALFGLVTPLELAQVAPFLIGRAKTEPAQGDPLFMDLPDERRQVTGTLRYFRGYFEDEWRGKMHECRSATSAEERAGCNEEARAWAAARTNPLQRFSLIIDDLVEETEIPPIAAIAFLLTDAPIRLPRLTYSHGFKWGGKNPGTTIAVTAFDLSVEPAEVARAYSRIRSELLRDSYIFPPIDRGPRQRIRTMGDRTRKMLSFCRARQGRLKFPEILKEWNATYPKWRYKTAHSLYNAFRAAKTQWGVSKNVS